MVHNISSVQCVKFSEFTKNSLLLRINFNKQLNRYLLDITRKFTYTKNGDTKVGFCTTYLNLTAAKALVDQLQGAYQLAKNLQVRKGVEMYRLFCLISKTLYFSTQVSSKWLQKTRQMDCWGTLPQLEPTQSIVSPTICWTDANSLTVEQLCKDLGITETEMDTCTALPPAQLQADVLRTPEARPRNKVADPNKKNK